MLAIGDVCDGQFEDESGARYHSCGVEEKGRGKVCIRKLLFVAREDQKVSRLETMEIRVSNITCAGEYRCYSSTSP